MIMSELDPLYARLLQLGFVIMKSAAQQKNHDWIDAELEMLHNVPSLIGEPNVHRHQYYWTQERQRYIEWNSKSGCEEAKSRMRTYYEPIWQEMEPLIAELTTLAKGSAR
jgi:hypothetical protein